MSKFHRGMLFLCIAQMVLGGNIIILKTLEGKFPLFLLLWLRYFAASLILAYYTLYRRKGHILKDFFSLTKNTQILIFLQAACSGIAYNLLIIGSIRYTSALHIGLISSLLPVFIIVLAWLCLNEKMTRLKLLALAIAIIGLYLLNSGNNSTSLQTVAWWGDILALLAVIAEASFSILAKFTQNSLSLLSAIFYLCFLNLIMFTPLAWYSLPDITTIAMPAYAWLEGFWYILSSSLLFLMLWYRGLKYVSASTAGIFTVVMPMSTTFLAAIFLGESLTAQDLCALCFLLLAVITGGPLGEKAKAYLLAKTS